MTVFTELSLIILLATLVAGLMRLLKQPLIMGHIITGLLVGPQVFGLVNSIDTLETFSKIGISILLFIVGLGLSPKIIRDVGKIAVITGIGQILFTTIFGFSIAYLIFGYSTTESLYISIALTFSSTIIILKLLSDKKDLQKLYGRIAVGFLLVQDIVATVILLVVSAFGVGGESSILALAVLTLLKASVIILVVSLVSVYVLPRLSDFFAKSQEFLFLFSIGWGLGMAVVFEHMGFSIEIGALVAGVTLSVSDYSQEIGSKLKPLRDFFIITFFVLLGTKMSLGDIGPLFVQTLVFSVFVLVGNPLIVIVLMSFLRYTKRTAFRAGLTVAQISEFSLILVLLALHMGHVSTQVLSLVTMIGLTTIAGSTYLILYEERIYPYIAKYLSFFERKGANETEDLIGSYEVVLFGCNRVGYDFLKTFRRLGQSFLVVDFDPEVIKILKEDDINCRYGDAEDAEFLDELSLSNSKLVISTIPDYDVNELLITKIRQLSDDVAIICISHNIDESISLYSRGASYVILPHFIGGHFAAMLASEHWSNIERLNIERDNHIRYLSERKSLGHSHPKHPAY